MAKIDFSSPILDLAGKQISVVTSLEPNADRIPATLAVVCIEALLSPLRGDSPSGEVKMTRFELARKIHNGGEVSLSVDELSSLKHLVGLAWPALIQGATWELLDPK
ncbi:hypothetical protein [Rhizobium sp. PL01]|uniref:hypothetical protein n=1 Tax=Rhizobium sp. PL01 TaxID=3085631 RepID=UPI00298119BB|nr:hypothetical protein [Rhizobium sp. PL01]MDW5313721.1 hypothetical protein [Rhizobium sp. PL01]